MKWNSYTIETTTAAEDLIVAMLDELGIEGAMIENNVPLTKDEIGEMFIDFGNGVEHPVAINEEQQEENDDTFFYLE